MAVSKERFEEQTMEYISKKVDTLVGMLRVAMMDPMNGGMPPGGDEYDKWYLRLGVRFGTIGKAICEMNLQGLDRRAERLNALLGMEAECIYWLIAIGIERPGGEARGNDELVGDAFKLIDDERARILEKWGVQTYEDPDWYTILGEEFGEIAEAIERCGAITTATAREIIQAEIEREIVQTATVVMMWLVDLMLKRDAIDKEVARESARME